MTSSPPHLIFVLLFKFHCGKLCSRGYLHYKRLQPGSARVYLSRTINIYKSSSLCNWTLISGTGAFNRSTLEALMPHVHNGSTVRMERSVRLSLATNP